MARPRKFDENEVLMSALQTFWRQGFDATTYRELERQTGVGLRSLNNTFGEKEALFARVLEVYRDLAEERLKQLFQTPGLDGLSAFFTAFPDGNDDPDDPSNSGCLMVNSVLDMGERSPAAEQQIVAFREMFKTLFQEALLADGIADADARSEYLVSALWGMLVHVRMMGGRASAAPMARVVVETMRGWTGAE